MSRILDTIQSPSDLKVLSIDQLRTLAEEIRQELITVLAKTGGHLGPNLGVVELTLALHYVFNTPADNFVFDVSHQAYIHKLLTGRKDGIHTIRQTGGLNGFMLRTESEHDCYGAGHAGTALSAALGMASGRDLRGSKDHVVALCGDAAFTCGVTYEALNNVAAHTRRLIVVLNDNEWSIDKNVGAIASYFTKISTNPKYSHLHEQAQKFLRRIGGQQVVRAVRKAEGAAKSLILPSRSSQVPSGEADDLHKSLLFPSVIFEELGLTYYGPMDGHDTAALIKTFEFLKTQDHPVLLHVLTKKGKGFEPAIEKQKKFHGLGPYNPMTGETASVAQRTYSEVFADTLSKLADMNKNIVGITGAMPNGTALDRFQVRHPDRYFDVGIAEEHAVLFACGLATKGFKPVCAIYSTFLQRAFDMIVHDVALQNLPVVFCMDRGGLSGDDGPTHHGLFDISYLRCIPNMVLFHPTNEDELADMMFTAMHHSGPVAIRYPRGTGPGTQVKDNPQLVPLAKAQVVEHGQDVLVYGLGAMLPMAREYAAKLREKGYSVAVVNPRCIKPMDLGTLEFFARSAELVVTFEDHVLMGGFGSIVLESLSELKIQTPVVRIGWPDQFVDHGKIDYLREKYGLTVDQALQKSLPLLKKVDPAKAQKVQA